MISSSFYWILLLLFFPTHAPLSTSAEQKNNFKSGESFYVLMKVYKNIYNTFRTMCTDEQCKNRCYLDRSYLADSLFDFLLCTGSLLHAKANRIGCAALF